MVIVHRGMVIPKTLYMGLEARAFYKSFWELLMRVYVAWLFNAM
jgi:hypothetical protein